MKFTQFLSLCLFSALAQAIPEPDSGQKSYIISFRPATGPESLEKARDWVKAQAGTIDAEIIEAEFKFFTVKGGPQMHKIAEEMKEVVEMVQTDDDEDEDFPDEL